MSDVVLAVVGSRKFVNPDAYRLAEQQLSAALELLDPSRVVSGDADGLDRWAQNYCWTRHYLVASYRPTHRRWEPDGYKERNIRVAQECTHLLSIRCLMTSTYGSGWTADYAQQIGRKVRRVTVPVGGLFVSTRDGWST